ncbi:MAG: AI-2E family transporter [Phycisphaerales bacterium]|nr:AI-2E family transporter [Phycisphaerales bacterium]
MPDEQDTTRLSKLHLWQIQGVRDALVIAMFVVIFYAGYAMRSVTVPLLIAFGLAYLVEPLVESLCQRLRMSRPAAVGTIMATAGLGLLVALVIAVPIVIGQSVSFVESFRSGRFNSVIDRAQAVVPDPYQDQVQKIRSWFSENVGSGSGIAPSAFAVDASNATAKPASALNADSAKSQAPASADAAKAQKTDSGVAANTAAKATATIVADQPSTKLVNQADIDIAVVEALNKRGYFGAQTGAAFSLTNIFGSSVQGVLITALEFLTIGFLTALIPFYFWFFSVSFPSAIAKLSDLIPEKHREGTVKLIVEMDHAVSGFVRGRIVISLIMAILFAIGWKVCGVPYAITLGLVIGLFSVVPYLSAVGLPIAIGLLIVDQLVLPEEARMSWMWIVLGPSLVYAIVQLLEGYVLIPVIAGRATDLGPVSIFVAVLAGAALAGVYGMLLSIPVAACLKIYGREVIMPRVKAWGSGQADDLLPLN